MPAFLTRPRRYTGRRAQGIRYERKAQEYLSGLARPAGLSEGGEAAPSDGAAGTYIPSQWWRFGAPAERWCQTDGLFLLPRAGLAVVVEIKYQHTADAWFQLRELYEPVVGRALGPAWQLALVEVVKWFDPATFFPERIVMCPDPLHPPLGHVGVHIWAP